MCCASQEILFASHSSSSCPALIRKKGRKDSPSGPTCRISTFVAFLFSGKRGGKVMMPTAAPIKSCAVVIKL